MGNSESVEDRAREFWFEHCGDFTQDAWEKMASFAQSETASLRAENERLKGKLEWIETNATSIALFIPAGELQHSGYNASISISRYRNEISAHVSGELPEQVASLSEAIERIKALTTQADKDEL